MTKWNTIGPFEALAGYRQPTQAYQENDMHTHAVRLKIRPSSNPWGCKRSVTHRTLTVSHWKTHVAAVITHGGVEASPQLGDLTTISMPPHCQCSVPKWTQLIVKGIIVRTF
jgi:hypothetical protein